PAVLDLDLLARGHHRPHVLQGHVATGPRVVELAVLVAGDRPDPARRRLGHVDNITQCVIRVNRDNAARYRYEGGDGAGRARRAPQRWGSASFRETGSSRELVS